MAVLTCDRAMLPALAKQRKLEMLNEKLYTLQIPFMLITCGCTTQQMCIVTPTSKFPCLVELWTYWLQHTLWKWHQLHHIYSKLMNGRAYRSMWKCTQHFWKALCLKLWHRTVCLYFCYKTLLQCYCQKVSPCSYENSLLASAVVL